MPLDIKQVLHNKVIAQADITAKQIVQAETILDVETVE